MAEYYEIMTDEERRARDMKEAGIKNVSKSKRSKVGRIKDAASRAGAKTKEIGRKAYSKGSSAVKKELAYRSSPEAAAKRKERMAGLMEKLNEGKKQPAPRSAKKNKRKKAARSRRAPQQEQPLGLGFDLGAGNSGGGWFDEPAQKRGKTSVNDSYGFYWGEPKRKGKKQKRQQQQSWF